MLTNGRRGIHLALLGLFHHLTPQLKAAADLCDAINLVKRETAALLVGQVWYLCVCYAQTVACGCALCAVACGCALCADISSGDQVAAALQYAHKEFGDLLSVAVLEESTQVALGPG